MDKTIQNKHNTYFITVDGIVKHCTFTKEDFYDSMDYYETLYGASRVGYRLLALCSIKHEPYIASGDNNGN